MSCLERVFFRNSQKLTQNLCRDCASAQVSSLREQSRFQFLPRDFAAHADKIPPYVYQLAEAFAKSNMAVCTILGSVQRLRLLSSEDI